MEAIVAVYADWGIGAKGTQPIKLRADRSHFREKTMDAAVIVGRKTMEDRVSSFFRPIRSASQPTVSAPNMQPIKATVMARP